MTTHLIGACLDSCASIRIWSSTYITLFTIDTKLSLACQYIQQLLRSIHENVMSQSHEGGRLSYDCRTIIVRLSYDCRTIVVRLSYDCRTIVVRLSYDCRTIVVRLSYDCCTITVRLSYDHRTSDTKSHTSVVRKSYNRTVLRQSYDNCEAVVRQSCYKRSTIIWEPNDDWPAVIRYLIQTYFVFTQTSSLLQSFQIVNSKISRHFLRVSHVPITAMTLLP